MALAVVEDVGIQFEEDYMYRNSRSVTSTPDIALTEFVANAWDAGAYNVFITIPDKNTDEEIVIEDDGVGMTDEEFKSRWIPNEVFRALSQDYLAEQKQVQAAIPLKESELEQLRSSAVSVESFIERAKRYPELPELNAEVLRVFIDKVVIGEKREKYSRHTFQKVTIYYRDIGLLDLADTKELQAQLGVA